MLLSVNHIIYIQALRKIAKCASSLKQEGKVSMLLWLDVPVSLQEGTVMAPKAVNRCVCEHAQDTERPVQAQCILMKRLLHNAVKVNETLSNYLPCVCQSCKFNPPSASNFPPEYVSVSPSDAREVGLPDCLPARHLTLLSAVWLDLQPPNLDDSPRF